MTLKHGADSDRKVVPLAQQIVEGFVGSGFCPEYLKTMPQFTPAVESWARLEARAALVSEWLAGMSAEEMSTPKKAGSSAPVEIWMNLERAASRARERLGLDPASWAKLRRDLGIAHREEADAVAQLGAAGGAVRERREAELRVIEGTADAS